MIQTFASAKQVVGSAVQIKTEELLWRQLCSGPDASITIHDCVCRLFRSIYLDWRSLTLFKTQNSLKLWIHTSASESNIIFNSCAWNATDFRSSTPPYPLSFLSNYYRFAFYNLPSQRLLKYDDKNESPWSLVTILDHRHLTLLYRQLSLSCSYGVSNFLPRFKGQSKYFEPAVAPNR